MIIFSYNMNILLVFALFAVPALGARLSPIPELLTDSYIINGKEVDIKDHPYQGSLRYYGKHKCGCVFIGGRFALTAAHCLGSGEYAYTVQFGSSDSSSGGAIYELQGYMYNLFINNKFAGYPNDIAIMWFKKEVQETASIQKIRMATPEDGDFANAECYITGWGETIAGKRGDLPTKLQGAPINVLSYQECKTYWGVSTEKQVCIGGENGTGSNSCQGDSGGPLTCKVGGKNVLVGLASWGVTGCYNHKPSVYTRMSAYRSWVMEKTGI